MSEQEQSVVNFRFSLRHGDYKPSSSDLLDNELCFYVDNGNYFLGVQIEGELYGAQLTAIRAVYPS